MSVCVCVCCRGGNNYPLHKSGSNIRNYVGCPEISKNVHCCCCCCCLSLCCYFIVDFVVFIIICLDFFFSYLDGSKIARFLGEVENLGSFVFCNVTFFVFLFCAIFCFVLGL